MKNILSKNIEEAWLNTRHEIENLNNITISSEKTLVFKFAMELSKLYNCKDIIIDFEVKLYEEIDSSDKYLDLLVYETEKPEIQYAIEFKAPMKSAKGNSNQTETRKKIYRDIARLAYLKEKSENICNGYFLLMTDENPYFNYSDRRDNTFDTSNNYEGNLSKFLDDYNINKNFKFNFIWDNLDDKSIKGKFAWLDYIKV